MADRKNLAIIGCILGTVTAAVMGVGILVVQGHVAGRYSLDDFRPVVSGATSNVAR